MKKTLLTLTAMTAVSLCVMANEYKFVFDGMNDMGGLTRQTSNKAADLTFSQNFTMTEEGVTLEVTNLSEAIEGNGFALINAGGTNAGLCVYSGFYKTVTPEISLTVPNGHITGVTLTMSGTAMTSLDIPFNGTNVECTGENPLFTWVWTDDEGAEKVTCSWTNTNYARYIHSIEVVYTPDLGGKQACDLAFISKSVDAILGETFNSPYLSNPHKLGIEWSSSDEKVATVDADGKVTLVDKGTTVITASTEGNDEYAGGNAKYELHVIPSASNIAELKEFAPNLYDRVKVNFAATVNFGNLSFAYVTDEEGNATCFDDMRNRNSTSTNVATIYSVGDVIPAGWIATNATVYESAIWEGLPEKSHETVEVVYPKVTSITPEDADRVVVLENVTFETRTAEGNTKAYGTAGDGMRYEFQDTFNTGSKPAGTYDVTGVVKYSKRGDSVYFYMAPIKYTEYTGSSVEIQEATSEKAIFYDLNGTSVSNPKSGINIKIENGKSVKILKK